MSCKNKVSVFVESGFHHKEVKLKCGSTGPDGVVQLCETCLAELTALYPQGWIHHPGDVCIHGTYLNPDHDCCCARCELGDTIYTVLCYCGAELEVDENDLGFEEYECPCCYSTLSIPSSPIEIYDFNEERRKEIEESRYTGKIIIMGRQETGEEKCYRILPGDDEELISLVMTGYKIHYPECDFYTEKEINQQYAVEQYNLHN